MAPTPVFLPGKFHGQRSLAGYSPWGYKESDTTERLTLSKKLTYVSDTARFWIYIVASKRNWPLILYFENV